MDGNEMALVNGSNEYWKVYDHAERIYRKKCNTYGSEHDEWVERGKNLADQLREKHGYGDSEVESIIDKYYLDRD